MVRGTPSLERYASVIALWLLLACEALAQNPSFKSFDTNDFVAFPPSIRLRNVPSQQGTNTYITNLFVNQEFVTNLTATYIYNTYLVTSNLTAGNVVGTLNTLAMFTPDGFSLGDSIVTQPDGNSIQVNGTNSGAITLNDTGLGNPKINWGDSFHQLYKTGDVLWYDATNAAFIVSDTVSAVRASIAAASEGAFFLSSSSLVLLGNSTHNLQFNADSITGNLPGIGFGGPISPFGSSYWNGTLTVSNSSPVVEVLRGSDWGKLSVNASGQPTWTGSDGSGVVNWGGFLVPEGGSVMSLSSTNVSGVWHDLGLNGAATIFGFLSTTNYSRVQMYHQGTNGAVVIDSQSGGSAGSPRPLVITNTPAIYNGIPSWSSGIGSPEGAKTAPVGSFYCRTDGGANTTLYIKESGSGNTGWIAK